MDQDFAALVEYLKERNASAAIKLGHQLFAAIDKLARGAFDGPEQTLETGELVRSWPVPPLRVYYKRMDDALWVVRLYHQARMPIAR